MSAGRWSIALAAMIFGNWDPMCGGLACLLFAAAEAAQINLKGTHGIPPQFVQMILYVLTIIALAGVVGKSTPPAALGGLNERIAVDTLVTRWRSGCRSADRAGH